MPDSKLYVEWRERLKCYVVIYQGRVLKQAENQKEATDWIDANYPDHAYEIERVLVRKNSPRGAKVGEWRT